MSVSAHFDFKNANKKVQHSQEVLEVNHLMRISYKVIICSRK
jgi:hypothetical protein